MSFEIIFITEQPESNPAAEIQFGGQRLCVIRIASSGHPEIEFVQEIYVGRNVEMTFPVTEFLGTIHRAVDELGSWSQRLAKIDAGA
jgi:hypothetical protein